MMRLALNKRLKVVLVCFFTFLIATTSYLLNKEIKIPIYETQSSEIYSYNNNASVDYKVYLKPNDLFRENALGPNEIYIISYIDRINTNFYYKYDSMQGANIKGEYNIHASVEGLTRKGENIVSVWEKEFPILQNRSFNSTDGSLTINEEVNLYLDQYNTFVKETIEATKINCDTTLTLIMDINLTGTTDKGIFEEHITPNIVIPLNTPMFEITTNNIEEPGAIEKTIQVQLPINKNKVILYSAILGIATLGLIFLIFFTKSAPKKDALEIALNKIFKKHGDRLVALSSSIDISNARTVRSIDDLVRLADEINKPILYKYSEDYNEINEFFITNDDEIYLFELEGPIPEEVTEEAQADGE